MTVGLLAPSPLADLAERLGGELRDPGARATVRGLAPIRAAREGDLAPLFDARYLEDARLAVDRGAALLVDAALASTAPRVRDLVAHAGGWLHPHAAWALAGVLDLAASALPPPVLGEGARIGPGAVVLPGVRLGARVVVEPGAIVGAAGFGFATGPGGRVRAIPQLGGVEIGDDVHVGAGATIAAGTLGPTRIGRGVKLDAQVHVAHNCEIGAGTIVAAQCGFAGSVRIGRGVLVGGQVGVADHVVVGDGARIAAKSGVIGDVPPGATFAGYPAVERGRWLRGLASMYRRSARE